MKSIRESIPDLHKEGYIIILGFIIATILCFSFSVVLGSVASVLTTWCVCFFRDPSKNVPIGDNLIVSAGDGVVCSISKALPPAELDIAQKEMTRVSVFLSVFDVHVNRLPMDGTVTDAQYHAGKFISASLDKSSDVNERHSLVIKSSYADNKGAQTSIAVVRIAGLIARRIVSDIEIGDNSKKGSRFGIIKFGSRVDIYMPVTCVPLVRVGQRVCGGETVIADLSGKNTHVYEGEKI